MCPGQRGGVRKPLQKNRRQSTPPYAFLSATLTPGIPTRLRTICKDAAQRPNPLKPDSDRLAPFTHRPISANGFHYPSKFCPAPPTKPPFPFCIPKPRIQSQSQIGETPTLHRNSTRWFCSVPPTRGTRQRPVLFLESAPSTAITGLPEFPGNSRLMNAELSDRTS